MDRLIYDSEPTKAKAQAPLRPMVQTARVHVRGGDEVRVMAFGSALRKALSYMKAEQARSRKR